MFSYIVPAIRNGVCGTSAIESDISFLDKLSMFLESIKILPSPFSSLHIALISDDLPHPLGPLYQETFLCLYLSLNHLLLFLIYPRYSRNLDDLS